MANLDYAFLADYATVDGGRLSAHGMSFTEISTATFPLVRPLYVAGRLRSEIDFEPFQMSIDLNLPGEGPDFEVTSTVDTSMIDHTYNGKCGVLFSFCHIMVIPEPGIVEVKVRIEGNVVRVLKFEVAGD